MAKTNFVDGSPVTPAFLNAINNPIYSENPSQNGEIPFPPALGSPSSSLPVQLFANSSCRGAQVGAGGSFDFVNKTYATMRAYEKQASAAGFVLGSGSTISNLIISHAAGDPSVGFWLWNVVGSPTPGQKLELILDSDFLKSAVIYSRLSQGAEDCEYTYQLSLKNPAGYAQYKASLSAGFSSYPYIEVLETSPEVTLNSGDSATLWARIKIKGAEVSDSNTAVVPKITFTIMSSSNFRFEISGLGVFSGNTFGRIVPTENDYLFAKNLSRRKISRQLFALKNFYVPMIFDNTNGTAFGHFSIFYDSAVTFTTPNLSHNFSTAILREMWKTSGPGWEVDLIAQSTPPVLEYVGAYQNGGGPICFNFKVSCVSGTPVQGGGKILELNGSISVE